MLQRLTLRGVLALLLVLTGGVVTPVMSARIAYTASITQQRAERGVTAERPADWPAYANSIRRSVRVRAQALTPPSRLAEHALFQRPPPTPVA